MSTLTHYEVRDDVAVITLDSPPVNGLGQAMRLAIQIAFRQAVADPQVQAIVIASAGKLFCGGADISEFGSEQAYAEPKLWDLFSDLEESPKPIVAAINGIALGGGCEMLLACDYRIASQNAKIGLPEVHLGLIPGAGGTQRLPRLAGVELALNMIVSGKPVSAANLHQAGAIDRVHEGQDNLTDAAVVYARELIATGAPVRSCAEIMPDVSELPNEFFDTFRQGIARKSRGYFAPERCIQAVEAACQMPLVDGLRRELSLFKDCMNTSQARAQQRLFFAQRAATKIPGIDAKAPLREIKSVAIIGAGTMGGGIAMNFLNVGIPTTILDLSAEAVERGLKTVRTNYEISAKRGRLTEAQVSDHMNLLTTTTEYNDIADADIVIEAVFENMDIKKKVFATLDDVCKPGAILASNTSTLDVDEIAQATSRPQDVVGLHFFSPANVMKLLEIVRGGKTADDALMTTVKMAQRIGKVPVVAGVCWGFIGNRMLEPYARESCRLILEGATPAQVDRVLTDFGFAMGYPSMIDMAGIDVAYLTRQAIRDVFYSRDPAYSAIGDKLNDLGRLGQKTGRGFYIYEGRNKTEDPEVTDLARQLAEDAGVTQREISDHEVLERTLFSMINEGARVLEDGIAYRSGDIDTVYCNGYGFPAFRGGPMQYADEIGLETVLSALNAYRDRLGAYGEEWFKPAPMLEKLVTQGRTFGHSQGAS